MTAADGKRYLTDVVDDHGVMEIASAIPNMGKMHFRE